MSAATKIDRAQARAAWQVRALELAFDRQLVGTARLVRVNTQLNVCTYHVPSADRRGAGHEVSVCGQTVRCDCPAGQYGVACSHAGAVVHYERQRAETSSSSSTFDSWLKGWEW